MIQCPHCGTMMHESARFCPGCGTPRTAVREELEQRAAETGVSYEDLLREERERDRQAQASTWAQTGYPPAAPQKKDNRVWWIVGVVGGGLLLLCVACVVIGYIALQRAGFSIGEGDAGSVAREQLLLEARGQWGEQWDLLHPAHQAVVDRDHFISCGETADLRDVRVIAEFNETVEVPRIGEVRTRVVTFSANRNGTNFSDAIRMLQSDGEWRWLMDATDLEVYASGRCP